MFFRGLFLSFVSLTAIIGITSFISLADLHFPLLFRPFLPVIGVLLLFFALWSRYLAITIFLCSAALTFFYAACRLKKFGGYRSGTRCRNTKRHPPF